MSLVTFAVTGLYITNHSPGRFEQYTLATSGDLRTNSATSRTSSRLSSVTCVINTYTPASPGTPFIPPCSLTINLATTLGVNISPIPIPATPATRLPAGSAAAARRSAGASRAGLSYRTATFRA